MDRRRAHISPDELPEDGLEGRHLHLPDRIAHYVRDVLRMSAGDALELFDGDGRLLECRLQSLRDDTVQVAVVEDRESRRNESPASISLCVAIPKGDRWRWILEKATELGVSQIQALETQRTVVDIPEEKVERKLDRWGRIVGEAARQCERTFTPDLSRPAPLAERLAEPSDGADLALHARRDARALRDVLEDESVGADSLSYRIWVGPEGGFSDDEVDQLSDSGAHFCHLGPRILRSETAAVAATTLVQAAAGDLSARDG